MTPQSTFDVTRVVTLRVTSKESTLSRQTAFELGAMVGACVTGLQVLERLSPRSPRSAMLRQPSARAHCVARTANRVVREMGKYEWRDGLLLRRVWDELQKAHVLRVVAPEGGAHTYWHKGRKYRLGYQKSLLLFDHDSALSGARSSAEDTHAKVPQQVWWPRMRQDVKRWVHPCAVCRRTKPQRALTFEQRSSLDGRTFQVVYIGAIGPIHPPSDGNADILHAQDTCTGLSRFEAVPRGDAATTAKSLVDHMFLDFAGFPAVPRSDRGSSYVNEAVAGPNARFGVEQAPLCRRTVHGL